jgi:hypothetical protein
MKIILSMQTADKKHLRIRNTLLILMILLCVCYFSGCSNSSGAKPAKSNPSGQNKLSSSDGNPAYVRFSSFQNPDSTWGFTIFVDSRPFLLYKKIPVTKAEKGFASRKDAESVAALFMKMVKNGDTSPKLTKKALDTLGIILK